ncbi:Tad domain-containing protein [Neobacillus niacini]|uniref:Tad domain-containing protein n=1 Tax=Neobacillus niacini TaxID=86668 RepID=UPI0005EDA486|nr:Tad domain-containing protein [Neobacillus niacini]
MIKKLIVEEKGQSMVLVAVFLVALIGFAGLAIDGGKLYLAKSELQKAVDAGALAGADSLIDTLVVRPVTDSDYTDAEGVAKGVTENNYPDGTFNYDAFREEADYVEVSGEEQVSMMLMQVLGFNDTLVNAVAKVKIAEVKSYGKGKVIPVGIHLEKDLLFGQPLDFTLGPVDIIAQPGEAIDPGWYGYLDFSSIDPDKANQGTKDLTGYIADGSPVDISIDDEIEIREGTPKTPVSKAITDLIGQIVYVPIVGDVHVSEETGAKVVTVEGFAVFKLTGYDKDTHTIKAEFQRKILPGEIGDETSDYGTFISKLIQ